MPYTLSDMGMQDLEDAIEEKLALTWPNVYAAIQGNPYNWTSYLQELEEMPSDLRKYVYAEMLEMAEDEGYQAPAEYAVPGLVDELLEAAKDLGTDWLENEDWGPGDLIRWFWKYSDKSKDVGTTGNGATPAVEASSDDAPDIPDGGQLPLPDYPPPDDGDDYDQPQQSQQAGGDGFKTIAIIVAAAAGTAALAAFGYYLATR